MIIHEHIQTYWNSMKFTQTHQNSKVQTEFCLKLKKKKKKSQVLGPSEIKVGFLHVSVTSPL